MAVRVQLRFARPSMRLTHGVVDGDGRPLVGAGSAVTPRVARLLRGAGVETIEVDGDVHDWELARTPREAVAALERRLAREALAPPLAAVRRALRAHLLAADGAP